MLKGKSEPVPIYRLVSPKFTPQTLRGLPGLRSRLVGREDEQSRLQQALDALTKRQGSRIAIVGEAGIGKSRLIAELRQTMPENTTWVEGRALSYTTQMSFFLARQLLINMIGLSTDAPLSQIDTALRTSVETVIPDAASMVYPMLARMLDLPLTAEATTYFEDIMPQGIRIRMLQAYTAFVRAHAQNTPLVLVWEDLHWADPSSLALLEVLFSLADEVPLMLVLVLRGEESAALNLVHHAQTTIENGFIVFKLAPLSSTHSEALLDNLIGVDPVLTTIRKIILNKAEGNAFFIEELIRSLIDAGIMILEDDRIRTTPQLESLRGVDIPPTLQGVIAARIDRLTPLDKQTLQTASVIGRLFQRSILAHLHEHETDVSLDQPLLHLLQRELIRQREEDAYIFKHVITQNVAYGTLLLEQRKRLHRRTAEAIEHMFPKKLDELASTVAYHYRNAEMPEQSLPYLLRAAERSGMAYANDEAIALYRTALEQLEHMSFTSEQARRDMSVDICEKLGSVLLLIGQRDEARLIFQRGLNLLEPHDFVTTARLNRLLAASWIQNRLKDEAEHCLQLAQSALENETGAHSATWWNEYIELGLEKLWFMYWFFQEQHLMRELVDQLEANITRDGTPNQRSKYYRCRTLYELARCNWYQPDEQVLRLIEQGVAIAKSGASLPELCFAMFTRAFVHLWRDELEIALAQFLETIPVAERCGDSERLVLGVNYAAITYRRLKCVDETELFARRTFTLATEAKMPIYAGIAMGNLAWVQLQREEFANVEATAREGLTRTQPPFPVLWATVLPLVAVLHQRRETTESVILLPILTSFTLAFQDWNLLSPPEWIGLANFQEMFADAAFWSALRYTLTFIVLYIPSVFILALGLAVLLNQNMRGVLVVRTATFLPVVASWVVVSLIWKWIFNPQYGLINPILNLVGIQAPAWLFEPGAALVAIVITSVWKDLGYVAVMYLGGLQAINDTFYEAAKIDGANPRQQFFRITLPLLTPTMFFVLIILLINSFQVFDQVWLMPMRDSAADRQVEVLVTEVVKNAFSYNRMGYASAMSWVLFALIFVITFVQLRMQKRWVYYESE